MKYVAFEAYEGQGDNYQKLGVYRTRLEAMERSGYAARVHEHRMDSKQDLEMVLEDNLTDEQAAEWAAQPVGDRHTPGPWRVGMPNFGRGTVPILSGLAPTYIADIRCGQGGAMVTKTAAADANVIAAAPEMLEALKHLSLFANFEKNDPDYAKVVAAIIAKAEGRE